MRHAGVDSGPVVAEKEAEAAVAAAKEAAHHQHEQALQRCNADWTARLGRQVHLSCLHTCQLVAGPFNVLHSVSPVKAEALHTVIQKVHVLLVCMTAPSLLYLCVLFIIGLAVDLSEGVSVSVCLPVAQHEAWHADVADALKASLQEAKAEAQRVRDCQAQLSRQHQVLLAPVQL